MEQVLGNLSVLASMPIFNLGLLIDGVLLAGDDFDAGIRPRAR